MCYSNGMYIVAGDHVVLVCKVRDGGLVMNKSTPIDMIAKSVIYGDGSLVMAGDGGKVMYSKNGVDWISASSAVTVDLKVVTYGDGVFVVGGNGAFEYSIDGMTWLSGDAAYDINGATWHNGKFISVCSNSNYVLMNYDVKRANLKAGTDNDEVLICDVNFRAKNVKDDNEKRLVTVEGTVNKLVTDVGNMQTVDNNYNGRITNIEGEVTALNNKTAYISVASDKSSTNFSNSVVVEGDVTANNITSVTNRVTTAEGEIDTLQSKMSTAETNITNMSKEINDLKGVDNNYDARFQNLESKTTYITSAADGTTNFSNNVAVAGNITSRNITNITSRLSTAEGEIDTLQTKMTTAEGNITSVTERMSTAETNITNITDRVSTAEGDIDNLERKTQYISVDGSNKITTFDGDVASSNITNITTRLSTAESNISNNTSDINGLKDKTKNISSAIDGTTTFNGNIVANNITSDNNDRINSIEDIIKDILDRVSELEYKTKGISGLSYY